MPDSIRIKLEDYGRVMNFSLETHWKIVCIDHWDFLCVDLVFEEYNSIMTGSIASDGTKSNTSDMGALEPYIS
ncbi:hypothetical protein BY996DRAFT_6448461 [Phakopsora pachyrhizi]|nr:hypothetical protein BY996DRAFT_6448461 [Phakopsora pachyrhizi]